MFELLDISKKFLESLDLCEKATLCDFTMGNGHDTEYLCRLSRGGKVYAFDVQKQAVENTRKRLEEAGLLDNAVLIHDSHANAEQYIKEEIDAGMFNLGYLPGGDKTIHTMRESTLPAIQSAIKLLKPGGIVTINVYPGHEEGNLEGQMLLEELSKYDKKYFCMTLIKLINSPDAPFIIVCEKYNKK